MKRIYVCSRFAGDVEANVVRAKRLCLAVLRAGHAPYASHLLYPFVGLDDADPADRELGAMAGLRFLESCDEMWVDANLGDGSSGMLREIKFFESWLNGSRYAPIVYHPPEWENL